MIQKLAFFGRLRLIGRRRGRVLLRLVRRAELVGEAAEQAVHMREGRRAAADVLVVVLGLDELVHLAVQAVEILVGDAHPFDDLVDLLDAKLLGAFQAKPLVGALAVFYFCDKDHSHVLFAAAAQGRFHGVPPSLGNSGVKRLRLAGSHGVGHAVVAHQHETAAGMFGFKGDAELLVENGQPPLGQNGGVAPGA